MDVNTNPNTCSKRVIVHEGLDLTGAISAAMAFDKEYVKGQKIKTGIYHSRTYEASDVRYRVYHTSTSIIVTNAEPEKESQIEGAKEDGPKVQEGVPA